MRTKVFISYSHKDARYLEQLLEHLAYYERNIPLEVWSDKKIAHGAQWLAEIKQAIETTKVAVLLISPSFLASKFIAENELPPLLNAAKSEGTIIFPVIVRPSNFEDTELANFQAVNNPSMHLARLKPYQRDVLWAEVVRDIRKALVPQQPESTTFSNQQVKSDILAQAMSESLGSKTVKELKDGQEATASNSKKATENAAQEIINSTEPSQGISKESNKLIEEVFKIGYWARGKPFRDISNIKVTRSEDGQILNIQYDES